MVLRLVDVHAFTGGPQDDSARADDVGDVDGLLAALQGVLSGFGIVGGVATVDRHGMLPETRRDELGDNSLAIENLLCLLGFLHDLVVGDIHAGHRVIVVELHALKAELLDQLELLRSGHGLSHRGSEYVGPFVDVPRAEGEPENRLACHLCLLCQSNRIPAEGAFLQNLRSASSAAPSASS